MFMWSLEALLERSPKPFLEDRQSIETAIWLNEKPALYQPASAILRAPDMGPL